MAVRDRAALPVVGAVCVGLLAVGLSTPEAAAVPNGAPLLRGLLVACGVLLFGVAAVYRRTGHAEQAAGHAVAGVGLLVAAAVGTGAGVWVGVALAGSGAALLLRDALRRDGNGRPSA